MRKIRGRFGAVAGIAALMGMMLAPAIAAPAQTFQTIVDFSQTNGAYPYLMTLVQGPNGNLYGTTEYGGVGYVCSGLELGCGSVFETTAAGSLTTLHTFGSSGGSRPFAGLTLGTDGNFYGTTWEGSATGLGTIFRMAPSGELTSIFEFQASDGSNAEGVLVQGTSGALYGTTAAGGTNGNGPGSIFEINSTRFATLYFFDPYEASIPYGGLIQATDGNFYGTTGNSDHGYGSVFKITPTGILTVLHSFEGPDGSTPYGTLLEASDGNLYGTTSVGGSNQAGTVFRITPSGTLTTLHSFCSLTNCADGGSPFAGLIQGTDGYVYGTMVTGGSSFGGCGGGAGCGTLFRMTLDSTLATLVNFGAEGGIYPYGGLLQATDGKLYGTTEQGGTGFDGTVFSLDLGLAPFVKTVPTIARTGSTVMILGTSLTGATSVTFNGAPAAFTVLSATEITTRVPTGATTGPVQVVTPSGTLTSNVNFRVEP